MIGGYFFSRTLYELCKKYDCKALIKPCVCNDDSVVAFVNPNLISGISFVYVNIKNLSLAKYNEAIHEFLHTNEKVFRHIINKDIGAKDFYDIAKLLYEKYK